QFAQPASYTLAVEGSGRPARRPRVDRARGAPAHRRLQLAKLRDRQACVDTRPRRVAVKSTHTYIGDPAVADAALDRVVHDAHQIMLKGESMRKKRSTLTDAPNSAT